MARKIFIDDAPKPFGNVNIKVSGYLLREGSLLWGNKTLAATKAFESYISIRRYMGKRFSQLFTFDETSLLVNAFPSSPLINYIPLKENALEAFSRFSSESSYRSCYDKLKDLSEVDLVYLLLELERINTIRSYGDASYLSFTDDIKY